MARKLRQINESLNGYEPEGREFESLRAHHSLLSLSITSANLPAYSQNCVIGLDIVTIISSPDGFSPDELLAV